MTKTEKLTAILEGAKFRRKKNNSYFYRADETEAGLSVSSFIYGNGKYYRHEGFVNVDDSRQYERLMLGTSILGKSAYVDIEMDNLELL